MKQIEQLYINYKEDVYSYLLSLTRNPTLSEDLLSETFVKAISAIGSFRGDSSVKTWLFSIARHMWLQNLKKQKPTVEYNDLLELYVADNVEEQFITADTAIRIGELITQKDERTQHIVTMRVEGYSYSEISQRLGLSESSARVVDFRTRKWIRSVLEKEGLN